MTTLEDLRHNPLYREARATLESYITPGGDMDAHLFDTWSVLLALEDHIDYVMADTHLESLVTKTTRKTAAN